MDIEKLLSELTEDERIALVSGTDFMYTNPVPRLGIEARSFSDGPHGLRKLVSKENNAISVSEKATAFPTAAAVASGWDPKNAYAVGKGIAKECRNHGVDLLLGPGANIKRNPLCGRNFEYFSEDPLLSASMASAETEGIQSEGVGACLKHFAANNCENYRFVGDSVVDERALREIYLKSFEPVIKTAKPYAVMSAYNQLNGVFCSENKRLIGDVLRGEWGYDGLVMTDWGGVRDRAESIKAGLDLEMPGDTLVCRKRIKDALASGELSKEDLDRAVASVLRFGEKCKARRKEADLAENDRLAADIAADCAVLMKNDGILPLSEGETLFVCGEMFDKMRYQGAGSSLINAWRVTSPRAAFDGAGVKYLYCKGYRERKTPFDRELVSEAVRASAAFDKIIVFIGLTDYDESEGCDRDSMRLPENQLDLVEALLETGKPVAAVLFGGSPFEMPFKDRLSAILNMYLPGQNGGEAVRKLLFGKAEPAGRLAESWPESYADVPYGDLFGKKKNEIYKESVFVGYRYYSTVNKKTAFPFGSGLSYTSFMWRDAEIEDKGDEIKASCEVENVGDRDGAEVVELFVSAPESDVFKPKRELRAFEKIRLKKGAKKRVTLTVKKDDLRYFNIKENRFALETGRYIFEFCKDAETPVLFLPLELEGETLPTPYDEETLKAYADPASVSDAVFEKVYGAPVPKPQKLLPITPESRFEDFRQSFVGRILYSAAMGVVNKQMKRAKKRSEGLERDNNLKDAFFLGKSLGSNSLRSISMNAGRKFPYNYAEGAADMANGHLFKGVKKLFKKIKAPVLPKDEKQKKRKG